LKALRQRGQALRQSFRADQSATPPAIEAANPRTALTDVQKQQLQQLRTEAKGIMLNVAQLAQKYESNIARLTQEVQPQREKWTTDMQAILARNTTAEQQQNLARFQGRPRHHAGTARFFRPAMFLLLDPTAPNPAERGTGGTSLYPNPVTATSQLDYTVTKAGPVTVELLDGRGNTLRTVAQEAKQEKGPHTLQANLGDLPTGTYYYKITTRAGTETKRFMKE
ncbi:MAG: T9SS type A sorting domain-containing protein, partial [Hymenobacter sp.]|nr:T9SS type A sorting domain-containing protein [Hymenobacter sp.]